MRALLESISSLAGRQHGLVSREQLIEAGFSERQVSGLTKRGQIERVRPCVYRLVGTTISWEQALMAAVMSVGADAVASHSSAARLWNFAYMPESLIEVSIGRERRTTTRGVRLHRSRCLHPSDGSRRSDIPSTTFERTLCDCTTILSEFQLGRILDDGLRRDVASLARLRDTAYRIESGPGHMSIIRSLLQQRGGAFVPGGSASELHVLDVLRGAGIPSPIQQHVVRVAGRRFELDFAWPDCQVFIEYYGRRVHSLPSAVAYDSERLSLLTGAGWTPLVFTDASSDREILDRTTEVLARRQVGTLTYRGGA